MTIPPQKVNWWYESIVDWMLMNPHKTKTDAARFFNVTPVWMYCLTNSDVFKVLYEERRKLHNGMVSSSVIEKTAALTEAALDHLTTKVVEHGAVMTPELLKDITEMGLEKLGYDGKYSRPPPHNGQQVQVNVNIVSADDLAEARGRLIEHGRTIADSPYNKAPLEPTTPLKALVEVLDKDAADDAA